ncbi:nitroreductase family protein [Labilibaculum manganireducens]|uniref:nitroreductase family protein n=1 Tax=Labilibaculum manganireducens TaxID=1940525 RepID=UPI0029F498CA|nr:nitroreductase family protein [Labilibaculum manganireducens]
MELKDVIEKRKTIRDFQSNKISKDIIDYAIENGFKAPTYNHLRDWDFIILNHLESKLKLIESENLDKPIDSKELEHQFKNEEKIMKEMYLDAIPKQKKMILEAPTVIIVAFKPKTRVAEAKKIYDLNCLASIWTCIENFLLSLAEYNVYGVTFIPQNIETIKKKLEIPDELEIASIIPIGYMADNARILKQKTINISERKHYEKW